MTQDGRLTRRTFLKRAGAAGVAVAGGTLWEIAPAAARARTFGKPQGPIRHVVVTCQENRSFDHYYGTHRRCRGEASARLATTRSRMSRAPATHRTS
jgi:phospholipase C